MSPSNEARSGSFLLSLLFVLSALFLVWHLTPAARSARPADEPADEAAALPNYDIRLDESGAAGATRAKFAAAAGRSEFESSAARKRRARAENALREKSPATLKIEPHPALETIEVIAAEAAGERFLTGPTKAPRAAALRSFLEANAALFGLDGEAIGRLEIGADYANPDGNLAFAHLTQSIGGVPVFNGEVKAGFTERGEIFRVINNLAPGLSETAASANDFGSAEDAVRHAAQHINRRAAAADLVRLGAADGDAKVTFAAGEFADATVAEKFYFPVADGVARAAWRVLLWTERAAFYVVVDARDGTLLWRKNLTENQTQPATYNVYGNLTSMMKTADSPTPSTPGCTNPNLCPPPTVAARQNFTLVGNEPPYSFNNLGWIPDGENRTIGNNVEAGIDRAAPNGIDPDGWAFGSPARNFVYNYNPGPGNPPPGEEPLPPTQTYPPSAFQQGSVTNAFYAVNRWHDETYLLGFTEAGRNFQSDNFGRGGAGDDSIAVEVQDGSGTNATTFTTPADGARPRAQFFIWTGPTPDRDGALDNQIVTHEVTHGLSNRLHGNAGGLNSNMARGMGEGWSDFYAHALLSEPSDDPLSVYSIGCYSAFEVVSGFTASCYYGLRRFPTARLGAVGPNGKPHNPLTFRYVNADCNVLIGTTASNPPPSSAFPRGPIGVSQCDQVHNLGEVWSAALWEVRGFLIEAHGAAEGNRRALQYVTDGMKLSPLNPTMLQSRDAIIAAAHVSSPGDARHVWRGFAARGMGFSARLLNASPASVVEAFDLPNASVAANGFAVNDAPGDNDGFPEPGEPLLLSIPVVNLTGETVTGVQVSVAGGGTVSYGTVTSGATVTNSVPYTVPNNVCGVHQVSIIVSSALGTNPPVTREFRVGVPIGDRLTFTSTTPVTIVDNAPASPYGTSVTVSGASGPRDVKLELTGLTHSFPADVDLLLVGPNGEKFVPLSDSGGGGDVSNLTMTLADAAINLPSTTQWTAGEFKPHNVETTTDAFPAPAPAGPYQNPAPAGAATFASVFGPNGVGMNGVWTLYVRDDTNTDAGSLLGWKLILEPGLSCLVCGQGAEAFEADSPDRNDVRAAAALCQPAPRTRADFDGDGRSDLAVFRPADGNWYVNRSLTGFVAVNWGLAGDRLTPGDFDGDGKTDFAVFRPHEDGSQPDFYVLRSSDLTYAGYSWGLPGDLPVIEDYDGDSRSDLALFRPSTRTFYVLRTFNGAVQTFSGIAEGAPAAGDFDGDGRADFATYSGAGWHLAGSVNNYASTVYTSWGLPGDVPVSADYDGDNKDDFAVFRPSDRTWYIRKSTGGETIVPFGLATDVPAPGDYDGDGRTDIAVYRDGVWYVSRSASGLLIAQFGLAGDVPIANSYLP